MHVYDTLIIGSGYSSIGYALKNENCIIIEATQCCDANFFLPLKNFSYKNYTPVTDLGKELEAVFNKYQLFRNGLMCTNALEPAFCEFISDKNVNVLLKCRVVNIKKLDGYFEVTTISSEGLSTVYAKTVFDSTPSKDAKKYLSVLCMGEAIDSDIEILSKVFEGSTFEKAFYDDRFVMYLPVANNADLNETLNYVHDLWLTSGAKTKILYVSPVFAQKDETVLFPKDSAFSNPVEAFEAGILFQGGKV